MTAKVMYCQKCGEGQVLADGQELRACPSCGYLRFHTTHPAARVHGWRWPGPTRYDRKLLRDFNIGWDTQEER